MTVSALMEAMAAAGAPMEAIILAVRALETKDAELQAVQQAADAKRAAHAEWKRNRRAEQAVSMDSPRTENGQSTPTPAPSPSSSPDPSNNPTPTHGDTPRARKAGVWSVPDGVEPRHWADFLANRKRKRLPASQTALDGVMRDLADNADELWPPGRLVEHAAAKGWGSINYPSDLPKNGNRHEPVRSNRRQAPRNNDGFNFALAEAAGLGASDFAR